MSRDPYQDVKTDVESGLESISTLLSKYDHLSTASPTSHQLSTIQDELRETLEILEGDLEDLEESVRAVENVGDRWGIDESEKRERRGFVEKIKREIKQVRNKVMPKTSKGKERAPVRYTDNPDDPENGGDLDEVRRWEMQEQQTLVRQQDDTLGVISGTLHSLASQAGLIGHEVMEQSEMLDDLSTNVDATDNRLRKVTRTLNDFIRRNEETKSGWCICILIFVLIALLIAVILT